MDNKFHTVRGYELQRHNTNILTPAMEDYLEMIYRNSLNENYIRINVLAKLLNVNDSSASKMVKKLGDLELVNYEKYGIITLTTRGKEIGRGLLDRHNIIEKFLLTIGCSENALSQTELIEHIITDDVIRNMEILCEFFEGRSDILKDYIKYRNRAK